MQSNPQSNPVFWNGFQIQVQSTKKECNQDFAILQSHPTDACIHYRRLAEAYKLQQAMLNF